MKKLLLIICGALCISVTAVQAQQSDTSRIRLNKQQQDMNRQQYPTKQKSTQGQNQYRRDKSATQGQYQTDTTGQPRMRVNRPIAQDTLSIQSPQGSQDFRKDTTGASPAQLRHNNNGTTASPTRKKNGGN